MEHVRPYEKESKEKNPFMIKNTFFITPSMSEEQAIVPEQLNLQCVMQAWCSLYSSWLSNNKGPFCSAKFNLINKV